MVASADVLVALIVCCGPARDRPRPSTCRPAVAG